MRRDFEVSLEVYRERRNIFFHVWPHFFSEPLQKKLLYNAQFPTTIILNFQYELIIYLLSVSFKKMKNPGKVAERALEIGESTRI